MALSLYGHQFTEEEITEMLLRRTGTRPPINFIATREVNAMCEDKETASPAAQTERAYREAGGTVTEAMLGDPGRSKFRPFSIGRRREEAPNGFGSGQSSDIEEINMLAQLIADAMERARNRRRPNDPRRTYEFDLARQHLEDVVMRATRGITS